jgi:CHAT domain-containing protein
MKGHELRRYFHNTCINEQRIRIAERGSIPPRSAIVYLLPLPERLELILSLPRGLTRFTVPVSAATLTRLAREFRAHLENRTSRAYLVSSQQLYSLLVTPYADEAARQGVDTLVFVPDGVLRAIPFAALHNGRGFLIDRWAVATIPTVGLTDLGHENRHRKTLLLVGISQANQGFAPLAHVDEELQGLQALYGGDLLVNHGFTAQALRTAIEQEPYSMVHIATHGEFMADAAGTFILAWDGRIDMDLLEKTLKIGRYRKNPIDLLTLSACQTAVDSERAALGLAGLALKTGVRSALATLWYVDDRASSQLMMEFYRRLTDPGRSKAQALQGAQQLLLADHRYRHPAYWSPFLLIGNWD